MHNTEKTVPAPQAGVNMMPPGQAKPCPNLELLTETVLIAVKDFYAKEKRCRLLASDVVSAGRDTLIRENPLRILLIMGTGGASILPDRNRELRLRDCCDAVCWQQEEVYPVRNLFGLTDEEDCMAVEGLAYFENSSVRDRIAINELKRQEDRDISVAAREATKNKGNTEIPVERESEDDIYV